MVVLGIEQLQFQYLKCMGRLKKSWQNTLQIQKPKRALKEAFQYNK